MLLSRVFLIVAVLWPVAEIVLQVMTRAKRATSSVRDRGSHAALWIVIALALVAGSFLSARVPARIPVPTVWLLSVSLALLVAGLVIRATAILTLGRFFTSNVAIQTGHMIVREGLYKHIRHPSYTGMLLAFLALALSTGNWISLVVIFVPITAATLYRIRVEELALMEAFGQEYAEYRRSTRCLVPYVY